MWGKWIAGLMLVGTMVSGGCEDSDADDIRGVGKVQETMDGTGSDPSESGSAAVRPTAHGNVADGEMIKDGGRMVRPGEE